MTEESILESAVKVATRYLIQQLQIVAKHSPERFGEAYLKMYDALEEECNRLGYEWKEGKIVRKAPPKEEVVGIT